MSKESARFYPETHQATEPTKTQVIKQFIDELLAREEEALAVATAQQEEYIRFHGDKSVKGRLKKATQGMFTAYRQDMSSRIDTLNHRIAVLRETLAELPNADTTQLERMIVKEIESFLHKINFLRSGFVDDAGTRDMSDEEIERIKWLFTNGIATLKAIDSREYATYEEDLQQRASLPRLSL